MAQEEESKTRELPEQQYSELITSLLSDDSLGPVFSLRNYHGFWYPEFHLLGALAFCDHFKPRNSDILLVSSPKSGTTWLKALAFATVNRKQHSPFSPDHPLLSVNPHDCIPFVHKTYMEHNGHNNLEDLAPPRLISFHLPYSVLPDSIKRSSCRIVYICRDPRDNLVSAWQFVKQIVGESDTLPFDEIYEKYCKGISIYGPVWDHNLEYWRESMQRPEEVLFLKYEDLMEEPAANVRMLAEFMGCPFSEEEEREGIVEGILKLTSFENLKSLKVNQKGCQVLNKIKGFNLRNSALFRKGKVGDWKNHLTPEMAQRLDEISEEKLRGSGLSFGQNSLKYN